jgi:hypothetical protein
MAKTQRETPSDPTWQIESPRPAMTRVRSDGSRLTADQKQRLLEGLRGGQSLASVLRDNPDLPGATAVHAERRADPDWAIEYEHARAEGVEANIDEALDYSYSVRGNQRLASAAAKYADAVIKSAALVAPKRYSQSLKLAGADGEKLSISLVAYAGAQQPVQQLATTTVQALPATDDNDD